MARSTRISTPTPSVTKRRCRRSWAASWAAVWALLLLAAASAGPYRDGLSPQEIATLDARAGDLWKQAYAAQQAGKSAEAIDLGEQLLVVQKRLFDEHEIPLIGHNWLALQYETADRLPEARAHREAAWALAQKVWPDGFWRRTDARLALEFIGTLEKLTLAQRAQLRDSIREGNEVFQLNGAGRYAEALTLAQRVVETRTALLGPMHPQNVPCVNNLASLHEALAVYAKAAPLYEQSLAMARASFGERHPSTITALNNVAGLRSHQGDFAGSLALFTEALQLSEATLGADHFSSLVCLNNVANAHLNLGDYTAAEPLLFKSLAARERILGAEHPDTAVSRNNLARLYDQLGDYPKAEALYLAALAVDRKALGEEHPTTARTMSNLGAVYESMGDPARAEPLYRQALAIREKTLPPGHPDIATNLNNLGQLLGGMGDFREAESVLLRALQIRTQTLGPAHPDTANSFHNMATLYDAMQEHGKARRFHELAVEVSAQTLGPDHPRAIAARGNLAMHNCLTGDYAAGLPRLQEVLEASRRVLGATHRDTLTALGNLAALRYYAGQLPEAEQLMTENLEATAKALGRQHPATSICLSNLGLLYLKAGQFSKAEACLREALENDRRLLDLSLAVQSERQQLRMAASHRSDLDLYLTAALRTGQPAAAMYARVLGWKGSVLASQERRRLQAQRPEVAPFLLQLQETSTKLAALAFAQPPEEQRAAWHGQIASLQGVREQLERNISGQSAEFRQEEAVRQTSAEDLRAALPEGFVLIDFLEYRAPRHAVEGVTVDPENTEARLPLLVAFVSRRGHDIVALPLGPAEPVTEAVGQWRRTYGGGESGRAAARRLRELIWQPLRLVVGDAATILISPDGALAQFPFAALPGEAEGKYLVEERSILTVPAAQRLPSLLSTLPLPRDEKPSLLLVGNVNYDAGLVSPTESFPSSSQRSVAKGLHFTPLPGTGTEAQAVRTLFTHAYPQGTVRILEGVEAAKATLAHEAPASRYLLLATHGFFAPAPASAESKGTRSSSLNLTGPKPEDPVIDPGLLSGLALAGANDATTRAGILTSLEVAGLDLHRVDLAVLSACETGLGVTESGEGVLGLQRAFQVAGARSTVTSLWKVDDNATRALMTEFHRQLWQEGKSKLEAFRAAQLHMLDLPPADRARLSRGLAAVEEEPAASGAMSPYYWAAFVLAGDWR